MNPDDPNPIVRRPPAEVAPRPALGKAAVAIRPATPRDVPLILHFIRELAAYEKLSDQVEATERRLLHTLFPEAGAPADAHVLLGEVAGIPVGFAVYFFSFSTFLAKPGLYLEDLFVKPDYRGVGVGRALLIHLARLACSRGCGRMEWSVLDWNSPAIEFYRRIGAVPLEEWSIFRLTGPSLEAYGEVGETKDEDRAES